MGWIEDEAKRAKARLEAVDAEVKKMARAGGDVRRGGEAPLPPVPTVVVNQPAPQVRVEGPVVQVPPQPPPEVRVHVEGPTVNVPAPQVAVRVEGAQVYAPEPRIEFRPEIHVEPTPVTVHVHMGDAVARLAEGLREAIRDAVVVNVPPAQIVVNVPEQPAPVVHVEGGKAFKYVRVEHDVFRDRQGQIVRSVERREYTDEPEMVQPEGGGLSKVPDGGG